MCVASMIPKPGKDSSCASIRTMTPRRKDNRGPKQYRNSTNGSQVAILSEIVHHYTNPAKNYAIKPVFLVVPICHLNDTNLAKKQ